MAVVNSAKMKVTPDELSSVIKQLIEDYGDQGRAAMVRATQKTTKKTRELLNKNTAAMIHGRRGKYEKNSWKSQFTQNGLWAEGVIYNKEPGLPHLLEHGHGITYLAGNKSKGPGTARAIPHIESVDAQTPTIFEMYIRKEFDLL